MADVNFAINPRSLANLLSNAVEIAKEASGIQPPDSILLAYQPSPDGKVGQVFSYGCGRYAAGRTVATLDGLPSSDSASVSITTGHAAELATAVRKTSTAASAMVGVAMHEEPVEGINPETGQRTWGNLLVSYQDTHIAHLHDSDPQGRYEQVWERMDDLLRQVDTGAYVQNLALQVSVLTRIAKMKGVGGVADLRATQLPGVVAAKLGDDFVALLGEVNKGSYAQGGRWGDGPGKAADLWQLTT